MFNVSNKVLVTLDLLLTMREHICRGEPPGNCAGAVISSLLKMPKAPTLLPEQQKYVVQKLYDGYYAFECLTEREWDEAICGICGVCPLFESADGNCKNCTPISKDRVKKRTKWHTFSNESLLSASMVSQQQ